MSHEKSFVTYKAPEIIKRGFSISFNRLESELKIRNFQVWENHDVTLYQELSKGPKYKIDIASANESLELSIPMGGMHSIAQLEDKTDIPGRPVDLRFYKSNTSEVLAVMSAGDIYGITLSKTDVENMYATFKRLAKGVRVNLEKGRNLHSVQGFQLPKRVVYRNRENKYDIWVSK